MQNDDCARKTVTYLASGEKWYFLDFEMCGPTMTRTAMSQPSEVAPPFRFESSDNLSRVYLPCDRGGEPSHCPRPTRTPPRCWPASLPTASAFDRAIRSSSNRRHLWCWTSSTRCSGSAATRLAPAMRGSRRSSRSSATWSSGAASGGKAGAKCMAVSSDLSNIVDAGLHPERRDPGDDTRLGRDENRRYRNR